MDNELMLFEDDKEEQKKSIERQESFSSGIRKMLLAPAMEDLPVEKAGRELPQYESIYELSRDAGLTMEEFVRRDPKGALRRAESALASWQNVLTQAAMTGMLEMTNENGEREALAVTKNQTKLLEIRIREARNQLEDVREMVLSSFSDTDARKDALEKSMYRRALKGDARLSIYLHDRVDGRPAETKQAELDYDNAYNVYAVIKLLFKEQLDVLNSGNGTRLICCSRRAGKSTMLGAACLIECMRKPRTRCIYIGETMELTEAIVGKTMDDIIETAQLKNKKGQRFDWR